MSYPHSSPVSLDTSEEQTISSILNKDAGYESLLNVVKTPRLSSVTSMEPGASRILDSVLLALCAFC